MLVLEEARAAAQKEAGELRASLREAERAGADMTVLQVMIVGAGGRTSGAARAARNDGVRRTARE